MGEAKYPSHNTNFNLTIVVEEGIQKRGQHFLSILIKLNAWFQSMRRGLKGNPKLQFLTKCKGKGETGEIHHKSKKPGYE